MEDKKTFIEVPKTWDDLEWLKIKLSQEDYDTIYDGPRPNGSSKSWYIKETGRLQPPMNMGIWNFTSETGEWFDNDRLQLQHQPHILDTHHCQFEYKRELENKWHLYVITVYNPKYFEQNKKIGFSVLDPQYQNDIRSGRCYVVILYPWEGYPGSEGNQDFQIIEDWRVEAGFPKNSVHLITGNLLAEQDPVIMSSGIVVHPFCVFDNWISHLADEPLVDFIPNDEKYLFLSYNRNPRYPRVHLGCKLIEHELMDKGLVSLGKPEWWVNTNIMRQDGIKEQDWLELGRKIPMEIGNNLYFNLACNVELGDFEKTFCSIVTETLVDEGTLFLSEKIWKPIQTGHPFFVLGNPRTLHYLRQSGYATFSEWWNEDYDYATDYRIRTEMILKELKKFEKYSPEDLKIIRNEMQDVLHHNKTLHYKQIIEKWGFNTSEKPEAILRLLNKLYNQLSNGSNLL
jgi:hypothetical protein